MSWSWNVEDDHVIRNSVLVARLLRRYELRLLEDSEERAFATALAANPADFTTAKVYADWLEEHDRSREAHYFREYDDAGFFDTAKTDG